MSTILPAGRTAVPEDSIRRDCCGFGRFWAGWRCRRSCRAAGAAWAPCCCWGAALRPFCGAGCLRAALAAGAAAFLAGEAAAFSGSMATSGFSASTRGGRFSASAK